MLTAGAIKTQAAELKFDLCGFAAVASWPELHRLREWLERGYAGEMEYLGRRADERVDPARVLPGARTAIVTATVYNVDRPYATEIADRRRALVSRYAWGEDYHSVIAGRMAALLTWMRDHSPAPFEARVFVDTGPVQEKVFAQYAGVGWIGKNTCVINPGLGSWFFLSVMLCTLELEHDAPALDRCGTCSLCIEACPTHALVEPGVLDATRCISYLTIEARGATPLSLRPGIGSHIFGCDICQDVCPYNATAAQSTAPEWQPRPGLEHPPLIDLWRLSDASLMALVAGTPLTRPKLAGLRRNIAVAAGNSGDPEAREAMRQAATGREPDESPSRNDPLVLDHAAWAAAGSRTKGIR